MSQHVVFVGNPGAGKSALLSSVVGHTIFKSGLSLGTGLTQCLQTEEVNGIVFADTPGLDDQEKRDKAAQAIATALRLGGSHKLFFVIKLDAGRVRPADNYLLRVVLDAVELETVPFHVIVNQLSPNEYDRLQVAANAEFFNGYLLRDLPDSKKRGHEGTIYIPRMPELDCQNDALMPAGQQLADLRKFVDQAKPVKLCDRVNDLNIDMWEQKVQELQVLLDKLQAERAGADARIAKLEKDVELAKKDQEPTWSTKVPDGHVINMHQVPNNTDPTYSIDRPTNTAATGIPVQGIPVAQPINAQSNDRCWNTDWLMFILGWFFLIPFFIGAIMGCCRTKNSNGSRHVNSSQQAAWILNIVFSIINVVWILIVIIAASGNSQSSGA